MEDKACPAEVFVKFDRRRVSIFVHKLNEHDVQPTSRQGECDWYLYGLCGGVADKGVLERLQVWKMCISYSLLQLLIFSISSDSGKISGFGAG